MKDLWLIIIGDMPASYQWAGAVVGFVLALLLLVAGRFGHRPSGAVKTGFVDDSFTIPGASAILFVERLIGPVVNIVFWLTAGALCGYRVAVAGYLTWPWCIAVVVVLTVMTWALRRWWRRRMGLE